MLEAVPCANVIQALFFSVLSYTIGHALVKVSLLCLYIRVFASTILRKICYVVLVVLVLHSLWLIFSAIFACVPVQALWDVTVEGARCLPREPIWFSNAGAGIFSDFLLFLLPLWAVIPLRLPRRQKVGLYFVFALGFL